ncbi:MAG: DsbA family protein [bacterium]|nr:DsbA family protein [bacterium]
MEHEEHSHAPHHVSVHETHHALSKRRDDLSIPIAIVIGGILIGGAIIFSDKNGPAPVPLADTIPARQQAGADSDAAPTELLALRSDDHIFGNPNANVLIIEYSDPECPFCKKFHESMLQVMAQYGKSGDVAWVYRHFPLDQIHPKARKEGEAQECANELGGSDMFWKYTEKLFEITPSNNGLDPAELPRIADLVGLNVATFETCLVSGKYADRVERDFQNGVNVGVKGTPYTIVWNQKTGKQLPINGAASYASVKSILGVVTASQAPKTD